MISVKNYLIFTMNIIVNLKALLIKLLNGLNPVSEGTAQRSFAKKY